MLIISLGTVQSLEIGVELLKLVINGTTTTYVVTNYGTQPIFALPKINGIYKKYRYLDIRAIFPIDTTVFSV